ncbi:heme-dependent oxidative N-demethylase family protein [Phormidesmis sp. 146-12]
MILEEVFQEIGVTKSLRYFPLANGRYEVKPGLFPLGTDFGNGQADRQVFQFDENFADYRCVKLRDRSERLEKYYQTCNYSDHVATAIARLMVDRLTHEHPDQFHLQISEDEFTLDCILTNETLHFDQDLKLLSSRTSVTPPYVSALDALAAQIQEDVAVICRTGDRDWLSAIHLCAPNYWSAEQKIGKTFAEIHSPVAGMERMNVRSAAIVNTMISHDPWVRFAWGLTTDTRLNHHPIPPPNISQAVWQGRQFDPTDPKLYLRIERQVIWGLPDLETALFTIRTYFWDCQSLNGEMREKLRAAIASMSPQSLEYKGLSNSQQAILTWLKNSEFKSPDIACES